VYDLRRGQEVLLHGAAAEARAVPLVLLVAREVRLVRQKPGSQAAHAAGGVGGEE
jgi:hypothetical protein